MVDKNYCPFCLAEGERWEIFEKGVLKRCLGCMRDFPQQDHGNKVTAKPIKGLKSILG